MAAALAPTGCSDDASNANDTEGTSGTEEASTNSDDSTTSTEGVDTTDSTDESSDGTDTGTTDGSRARILYLDEGPDDVRNLMTLDYESGPTGPPALVHDPLEPGENVSTGVPRSADRRWVAFRKTSPSPEAHELSVVDVTSPAYPDPVRINLAPAPDPGWAVAERFSPDSTQIAFMGGPDGAGPFDLYLVDLDGGPSAPTQINPPLGLGGSIDTQYVFSPDGARIAYLADFDGGGTNEIYIQNADITDPGAPVQVTTGGGGLPRWSPDGAVLYYTRNADDDGIGEVHAVDVSGAPSAPEIHDPGEVGMVRHKAWAPDGRGLTYWIGDDPSLLGDVRLVPLIGAGFGPPVTLNQAPGVGYQSPAVWSPHSDRILFRATEDGPIDGWMVELVGTEPSIPVRVNDALPPGAELASQFFDPSGDVLYYFVEDRVQTIYHAPISGERIGPRTPLSPPTASANGFFRVSDDGTLMIFVAADAGLDSLVLVDLSSGVPGPGVLLSPWTGPAADVRISGRFAPEGPAVFYLADGDPQHDPWLFAASVDDPGTATPVVDSGRVLNARVFALP